MQMSSRMVAGKKKYETFIKKQKKTGVSHKDAVALWKEQKTSTKEQSKGSKVPPKRKPPSKKKQSGFSRPKGIWSKLTSTPSNKTRVNVSVIKKTYVK